MPQKIHHAGQMPLKSEKNQTSLIATMSYKRYFTSLNNRLPVRCLLANIVLCASILSSPSNAHAESILQSNYKFKNSLSDSLNFGSDLVPIGSPVPVLGSGRIVFDNSSSSQGLSLNTDITKGDYRVELDIRCSTLNGFNKLTDFQSQFSDDGL